MNLKTIDQLAEFSIRGDPRVKIAEQKLKEFEGKSESLATQINSLTGEHASLEKQIASAMLNGSDPKTQRLTTLGTRKTEMEAEYRILGSVIEKAREQLKEIITAAQHEKDLRELEAIASAFDQFIEASKPFLEAQAVFEKALLLPVLSRFWGISRDLGELTYAYEQVLKHRPFVSQRIKELKASKQRSTES